MALLLLSVQHVASQAQYISPANFEADHQRPKATDTHLHGHTVLKGTDEHIPYVTIAIKGTTIGTASDATGHYYLKNLPTGKATIVVSGVGYKSIEKTLTLNKGESIELHFELEEDAVMLDNIVVSANRSETSRKEAANIVNVIGSKIFDASNAVCLAQGLSFQPGLRIENNCQNCGFQQVRINGLEGPYSQILIDSRPIFSALAGVYGIEQIPVNMIDRVEVVRGGGSALFGSNAIAGTINIITKEPLTNSLNISNSTTFIGGSSSDVNTTVNASMVSDDYISGVTFFGATRQRQDWDANADGFSEIGLINARNIGFRSYYKTSTQSKLTLEYHNLQEFRRGGNNMHMPAHQADITEQTDHNINSGGLKFDIFSRDYKHRFNIYSSAQHIKRDSYYGAGQDPNAYGYTKDLAFVNGMQYVLAMDKLIFMPADLTAGLEYNYNLLSDLQPAYGRIIDQPANIFGGFVQNEWKTKNTSILLGARLDLHSMMEKPIVSPRISLRHNPNQFINLRASYANGYRAPQVFDEDLHITAVGGTVQVITLDPDLRPESSNSFSLSADLTQDFGSTKTNLLVEGFYTDIHDIFLIEENGYDDITGHQKLIRRNGSGAVVKGINIEAKVIPSAKLNIQMGATLQQSNYKEAESWSENENLDPQTRMFRAPNSYGYITSIWNPTKALALSFTGIYTGSMLMQHFGPEAELDKEVNTPSFFDAGIKVSYDFILSKNNKLQINAGIQNIFNSFQQDFDSGEERDAGYIYGPSLPRSLVIGLKYSL